MARPRASLLALALLGSACGSDTVSASETGTEASAGESSSESSSSESESSTESESESETGDPEPDPEPTGSCSLTWQTTWVAADGFEGQAWDLALDADDNLYVAGGRSWTPFANGVGWLAKYDPTGELLWSRSYPSLREVERVLVGEGANEDIYVLGSAFAGGFDPPWVGRISSVDGELIWGQTQEVRRLEALSLGGPGELLIAGSATIRGGEFDQAPWLGRLSIEDGSLLSTLDWGPSPDSFNRAYSVAIGPQGTIYAGAGSLYAFEAGDNAPLWSLAPLEGTAPSLAFRDLAVDAEGMLFARTSTFEGQNTIMKIDPQTQTVLWSKSGAQLEHMTLAMGLDAAGNVVAAQHLDLARGAVRMWTGEGLPLCIEDLDHTIGAELVTRWFGGAGTVSGAGVAGIVVETESATLHVARFGLD